MSCVYINSNCVQSQRCHSNDPCVCQNKFSMSLISLMLLWSVIAVGWTSMVAVVFWSIWLWCEHIDSVVESIICCIWQPILFDSYPIVVVIVVGWSTAAFAITFSFIQTMICSMGNWLVAVGKIKTKILMVHHQHLIVGSIFFLKLINILARHRAC